MQAVQNKKGVGYFFEVGSIAEEMKEIDDLYSEEMGHGDEEDRLATLCRLRSGRALLAYVAAAEVGLPLLSPALSEPHVLRDRIPQYLDG